MNNTVKHFAQIERKFPIYPQIDTIGYMAQKMSKVNYVFSSCNFSFVLSGEGDYEWNGVKYWIKAPAVLLQWPNKKMNYGPAIDKGKSWEELYFIYSGTEYQKLLNSKVFLPEKFAFRNFERTSHFDITLKNIYANVLSNSNSLSIDKIDQLCFELISASFETPEYEVLNNPVLKKIRSHLEKELAKDINLEELAKKLNLSISSLRRYWKKYYPQQSFGDYRNSIFLQESCRLLVESDYEIKEIAEYLGFSDVYYFSRKFHLLSGVTATKYRQKHQLFH